MYILSNIKLKSRFNAVVKIASYSLSNKMATLVGKLTSQCAKNCNLTLIRRTFTSRATRFKYFNKQMRIEPPIVLRGLNYRRVKDYFPLSLGVCLCGSAMLGTVVLCAVSDDNLTSKNAENRSAGIIYIFVPIFLWDP